MSQSTARATTAAGAGELALAVISPPGLPQLTILGHLEPDDKMSLGSTCSSMRQASLSWFPDVDVTMKPGKAAAASLAAWLERHQARLHLSSEARLHLATRPSYDQDDPFEREEAEEYWAGSLAALPSSLMASLAVRSEARLPASVSTFTALTCLEWQTHVAPKLDSGGRWQAAKSPSSITARHLRPLMRLRHLTLIEQDMTLSSRVGAMDGGNADEVLSLPALAGLQALTLRDCKLWRLPRAVSALTALTSIDLCRNDIEDLAPLVALQRLQSLNLSFCSLKAVPEQVSALTALTRLVLSTNFGMAGGLQHLLPLTHLSDLDLSFGHITAVPEQVSALTALTRLDISGSRGLAGGWQHLLHLTRLRDLNLRALDLETVPQQLSALTGLTRLNLLDNQQLAGDWQQLLLFLTRLQDLDLSRCSLAAVPEQLSVLTGLTRLALSANHVRVTSDHWRSLDGDWQHLLHLTRLRDLNMRTLDLQAVPQQLSALTALTRLDLGMNQQLDGGWQHLLPLTQLCDLDLSFGSFAAVPEQVSALTALTCLNLTYNWSLDDGWQHLLSLPQLRHLKLPPDTTGPQQLTALTHLKLSFESLPLADS